MGCGEQKNWVYPHIIVRVPRVPQDIYLSQLAVRLHPSMPLTRPISIESVSICYGYLGITGPGRVRQRKHTVLLSLPRNLSLWPPHLHQEVLRQSERPFRRLEPLVAANGALDDASPAENLQRGPREAKRTKTGS